MRLITEKNKNEIGKRLSAIYYITVHGFGKGQKTDLESMTKIIEHVHDIAFAVGGENFQTLIFWLCGTVREELDLESERKYIEKEAALKFVQQLLEHDVILKQIDGQYIRYELRILAPTDWEREMFKAGGIV